MGRSTVSTDAIELLKWLGVAAMLTEHAANFVFGDRSGWPIIIGRAAFPFFAVALALGISRKTIAEQFAIAGRLAVWGAGTCLLVALVKQPLPMNVLVTFAAGVACDALWRSGWRYRHALAIAALPLLFALEYGPLGVAAVATLCAGARHAGTSRWLRLAFGAVLIAAVPYNAVSLLWWPVLLSVLLAPSLAVPVPRVRRAFYWIYAGQWPVLAVARALT